MKENEVYTVIAGLEKNSNGAVFSLAMGPSIDNKNQQSRDDTYDYI